MIVSNSRSKIVRDLLAAAVVPPFCTSFTLTLEANKVIKIVTESFASEEQIAAITAALESNPEEADRITREMVFRSPKSAGKQIRIIRE